MHQQELQLNNPKINSDKQLTARLNWVVWLIGSISGNIIIPRFLCHSYVKKWKEPPLLDILGHDNWRGAGLGTEPENTPYYVWPTAGSLCHHRVPALSPKVRQQLSSDGARDAEIWVRRGSGGSYPASLAHYRALHLRSRTGHMTGGIQTLNSPVVKAFFNEMI